MVKQSKNKIKDRINLNINVKYDLLIYMEVILLFIFIGLELYELNRIAIIAELIVFCNIVLITALFAKISYRLRIQFFPILLFVTVIWGGGIIRCLSDQLHGKMVILLGFLCLSILIGRYLHELIRNTMLFQGKEYLGLVLVCIAFFCMSYDTIYDIATYDSGVYFHDIVALLGNFNFGFENIYDYCLADHLSVGYGLFSLIGQMLTPNSSIGNHLVNMFLALQGICAYYGILQYLWSRIYEGDNRKINVLSTVSTAFMAFMPYYLGMLGMINLDCPSLYILPVIIWGWIYKYDLIVISAGWVFVTTKEPYAVYFGFMICVMALYEIKVNRKLKRSLINCIPVVTWFVYYLAKAGEWGDGSYSNPFVGDASGYHRIGFTLDNLNIKLFEILGMNFIWIASLFALGLLIYRMISHKKIIIEHMSELWWMLSGVSAGILVFNLFYIDYLHPRYIVVMWIPTSILLCYIIGYLVDYKNVAIGLEILTLLFVLQSFYQLDPLTKLVYDSRFEGYNANFSTYNRNYNLYQKAMEKFLNQIDYDEETLIVCEDYYLANSLLADYDMFWDMSKKRLRHDWSDKSIPLQFWVDENMECSKEDYNRIITIYSKYMGEYKYPELISSGEKLTECSYKTFDICYRIE